MGRPEAKIEDYLVERVKALGGEQRKLKWVGRDGAPDRLVWFTFPEVGMIEVKREGPQGRLEHSQKRELPRMAAAGWPVYVVASKNDVDHVLDAIRCCTLL